MFHAIEELPANVHAFCLLMFRGENFHSKNLMITPSISLTYYMYFEFHSI